MSARNGFTLVELLVTVAIIAILSAVGTVSFIGIRNKALDARKKADIDAIRKAYEQNYDPTENNGQGGYKKLRNDQFANGKIPTQPDGSSYIAVVGPASDDSGGLSSGSRNPEGFDDYNEAFMVCTSVGNNSNPCYYPTAATCYCAGSSGGNAAYIQSITPVNPPSCDPGSLSYGLAGYWKMDENTGTTIADSSGNGNTLTFASDTDTYDTPGWDSNNPLNNTTSLSALSLPTNDSRAATINNPANINIATYPIAYGAWVYLTSYPPPGASRPNPYGIVMQKGGYVGGYRIFIRPDGKVYGAINSADTTSSHTVISVANAISLNTWTLIFVTYDGSKIKLYINDGDPKDQRDYDKNIGATTYPFSVGRTEYNSIKGFVDEVRIYNRALNKEEISALYNGGNGCISP